MSPINYKKVIVFGSTGAIGRHLVDILSKEQPNWEIFAATRSTSTDKFDGLSNVKVVQADPNNREQVLEVSKDKDIVYSCIGFARYEAKFWAKHWPIVVDNLLAASANGPKLVFCDNLYAYGATTDISPTSPTVEPGTQTKPAIRAMLRQKLQERMTQNPSSITVVGGADFFGPYVTNVSFLGDTFTKAIVAGKPAPICIGSGSVVHDFAYAPDFSKALYVASIREEANGKFWVCPHAVRNKSLNQIATDIARLADSKNSKVTVYPGWSVRLLSPFMGFMWEMIEMLPFWSNDYSVDDSGFCKTFGVEPTPYEEALTSYIEFYKSL